MNPGKAFLAFCTGALLALVAWAGVDHWLIRRRSTS